MNSLELKDKQSTLIKRCQEIVDNCKAEIRDMTDEEMKEFEDNKAEIINLRSQLEELKARLESYVVPSEDNIENKSFNNNKNSNSMSEKFNLMKELRSAYETGKKINLAEINERAYTVASEGEDVVKTDLFDIWEPLRAKNVLIEAGAQYIPGIKNNIQIPLMGAVSVAWAAETGAASDGSGVFTSKTLTPKRITAKYPISLELLAQDSIGVEQAIRNDIVKAVNAKLEATLLGADAGDTTKPAGLFYGATKSVIASFGDVTALEADIEDANVYGNCKYIMSPSAKADLRGMVKGANAGAGMVLVDGKIDGTEVLATSHVSNKDIVYGDFSNLVIATWDNVTIDVVRDVASLSAGQVTIVVNAFVDAALVRSEALAYATTDNTSANGNS